MRTSTTIVEKIERLLLLPGWQYLSWPYLPPYRSSRFTLREPRR